MKIRYHLLLILAFAVLLTVLSLIPVGRRVCTMKRIDAEFSMLEVAIEAYKADNKTLPKVEKLGQALLGDNSGSRVYCKQRHDEPAPIKDPWDTPYQFAYTSTGTILIRSAGKDKIFSTEDDYIREVSGVHLEQKNEAEGQFDDKDENNKATMKIALAKAEKYVADKKLDVTKLSLSRICRRESIKNPKQNCWTIIWSPKKHHISGDELRVYIYDDGRIEHGRAS